MTIRSRAARPSHAASRNLSHGYQIVYAGDFSAAGLAGLSASGEVRAALAAGYRVGLLHTGTTAGIPAAGEMQGIERQAPVLAPDQPCTASLLILHAGSDPAGELSRCGAVTAEKTIVVLPASAGDKPLPAGVTSVPADPLARVALKSETRTLSRSNWRPVPTRRASPLTALAEGALRIGFFLPAGASMTPKQLAVLRAAAPDSEFLFWPDPSEPAPELTLPERCTMLDSRAVSAS